MTRSYYHVALKYTYAQYIYYSPGKYSIFRRYEVHRWRVLGSRGVREQAKNIYPIKNPVIVLQRCIRKWLDEYLDKTNFSKTEVIGRALTQDLGINDEFGFTQRLSEVEKQLFEIEKLIKK